MTIRSPAKFAAIIPEDGLNRNIMFFKKRPDILVKEMNRGNRQLGGIKPSPGIAGVAIKTA